MSILAELSAAERQRFTRMETTTITPQPTPAECGFTTWSRDAAEAVREALRGTEWRAEARAPYWPHPENETHGELIISVKIGHRWLRIVHTHRVPAYTDRDLFTLTVDGRPARYALHRGDIPHMPAVIANTAWRHVNGHRFGECAALTCTEPPTVATFRDTLCHEHADRYAEHGHW
jgi:hypothetical protein